jgi:hypothetical protein
MYARLPRSIPAPDASHRTNSRDALFKRPDVDARCFADASSSTPPTAVGTRPSCLGCGGVHRSGHLECQARLRDWPVRHRLPHKSWELHCLVTAEPPHSLLNPCCPWHDNFYGEDRRCGIASKCIALWYSTAKKHSGGNSTRVAAYWSLNVALGGGSRQPAALSIAPISNEDGNGFRRYATQPASTAS